MVRAGMTNGAETRARQKKEERRLGRTEMMLRWAKGGSGRKCLRRVVGRRAGVGCITG